MQKRGHIVAHIEVAKLQACLQKGPAGNAQSLCFSVAAAAAAVEEHNT